MDISFLIILMRGVLIGCVAKRYVNRVYVDKWYDGTIYIKRVC